MKTIRKTILMMGVSAMAGFSSPVLAADAPAPTAAAPAAGQTFGVVDMGKVMQSTDAAKDVFSQLEVKRKEFQIQISKEESSLSADGQQLEKQKDTLSKTDYEEKANALQARFTQEQRLVDGRKKILYIAQETAIGNLRHEAAKIVASIAKERHYSAVFTEDAVMISTPDLDMTDMVVNQMNKSVKKIPVDWAAATADDSSDGKKK